MRRLLARLCALLTALVVLVPPGAAAAHPGHGEHRFRALLFTKTAGFVHDSIPEAIAMVGRLGVDHDFDVVQTTDATQFTDATLATFDVVILAQASGDVWNTAQEGVFERYVRAGGGVVAIHNPLDMEQGNAFYRGLIGAEFTSHTASSGVTATLQVTDRAHPSTKDLPREISRSEEWYAFDRSVRGAKHVLTQLDESSYTSSSGRMGSDHPVTWCDNYEGGRTWITSMGHAKSVYSEPDFQAHALGGIEYAAGVAAGDCGATDWTNYEKVPLDLDTSAPWGIAVAPDGRVFYTELVKGQVRVYDPTLGRTVTAATIPVYSGGEDGLLGLAIDPGFATNHWVYVYYSPAGSGPLNRLSRFTMSGNTMDLASEKVVLEVPAGRTPNEIGHTGGTLRFDGSGNLYLSVGDDVIPFESSGYTPIDERPGRQYFDAQGSSANTNELRGKLLRIKPQPDGTYTIPAGNLFAPGTAKTRPEIYAMGFRNGFRYTVDIDGTVYLADYGPDAGSANANRGPAGIVEWNIVKSAGNYGWPYCIGNNIPFNDYNFATNTSGAKFDCANPVNTSPNNTGLTNLPSSRAAEVWYSYGASAEFPQLGTGAGAPMAGPVYRYDANLQSDTKWPAYFSGTPLFYEWGRNYIKEFPLDAAGKVMAINPVLSNLPYKAPVDMAFGPNGSLYLLEWGGGFGRDNPDSGLYRIDYVAGGRAPTAVAGADRRSGPAPLTVAFTSAGTRDADGDVLTYRWDFGDGTTSTDPNPTHAFAAAGEYPVTLTVTERDTEKHRTGTAQVTIVAGNTAPTVAITAPVNGGFFGWGDSLPWQVTATDPDGPVSCADVVVQAALGHDDHAHPTDPVRACSGVAPTFLDEGHAAANAFWAIDARYTDAGLPNGTGKLTGTANSIYRPKRFQAHYFTAGQGVAIENHANAEYGQFVGNIQDGEWVKYGTVSFQGIDAIKYRVAAGEAGGRIEARLGSPTGQLVATTQVANTGGWFTFTETAPVPVTAPAGTHDLYLVFRGNAGVNYSLILDTVEVTGAGVGVGQRPAGDWVGVYGRTGHAIPNVATSLPSGVTVTPAASATPHTWANPSTLPRALQHPSGTGRVATTWFNGTQFDVQVSVPARTSHTLAAYFTDYDGSGRAQVVELVNAAGQVISSTALSGFADGRWLTWTVTDPVTVRVRRTAGPNAVLSGLFLTSHPAAGGTWTGSYGQSGHAIPSVGTSLPSGVSVTTSAQAHTWAASTTDARALEKPGGGRSATTWFGPQVSAAISIPAGSRYAVSAYFVDWDSTARRQRVELVGAGGTVVASTDLATSFNGGRWLSWTVAEPVTVRVTSTAGPNAVLSGVFLTKI
ncbi:MAG TPA: ThuA domain-containing protein [Actinokineospora sp.]|nr:ThuA domain-containing protein [Actinokineospora sp.]